MPKVRIDNVNLYFKSIKDMEYVLCHMSLLSVQSHIRIIRNLKLTPEDLKRFSNTHIEYNGVRIYTNDNIQDVADKIGIITVKRIKNKDNKDDITYEEE